LPAAAGRADSPQCQYRGMSAGRGHPRRVRTFPAGDSTLGAGAGKGEAMDGMVRIPGATFLMGSDGHYPEEAPAHQVTVGGFWMDAGPVTNREFGRFVRKTGYVTVAERAPDPAQYPGARPELLVPFSSVFVAPPHRVSLDDPYQWWKPVRGADWRHPIGP